MSDETVFRSVLSGWREESSRQAPAVNIPHGLGLTTDALKRFTAQPPRYIIGCDEVGRGALAGPATVAAFLAPFGWAFKGLRDSKKVKSKKRREEIAEALLKSKATPSYVCSISNDNVDKWGINLACQLALEDCLESMRTFHQAEFNESLIVTDAGLRPRFVDFATFPKADDIVMHISAASVLAKTHRDGWMQREGHRLYPQYDFAGNAGYNSEAHKSGLRASGPSPLHRMTFLRNFNIGDEATT